MRRCNTSSVHEAASNLQLSHMLKSLLSYITQRQHSSYPLTPNTGLSTVYKQSTLQFCFEHHLNSLHRTTCLRDIPDKCSSLKSGKITEQRVGYTTEKNPFNWLGKTSIQTSPSLVYTHCVCIN